MVFSFSGVFSGMVFINFLAGLYFGKIKWFKILWILFPPVCDTTK